MKYVYQTVTEPETIDVDEKWVKILKDLDAEEERNNRKETRRHVSLENLTYEGDWFVLDDGFEKKMISAIDLNNAISRLTERQQYLIKKVYFEGKTYSEIARLENKHKSSIAESVQSALKKLKIFLVEPRQTPSPVAIY